jgi:hypothetical protein
VKGDTDPKSFRLAVAEKRGVNGVIAARLFQMGGGEIG